MARDGGYAWLFEWRALRLLLWFTLALLINQSEVSGSSLYANCHPVTELVGANYSETLSESATAWGVVHYASWCGHCQRFAPIWCNLARDIQSWSSVIQMGSIACDLRSNSAKCRELNITGYPTVRLYHPEASTGTGNDIPSVQNVTTLRRSIIDFLSTMSEVMTPGGRAPFPDLSLAGSLEEITSGGYARDIAVVCENPTDSYLARTVILDLSDHLDQLTVRRMDCSDREEAGTLYRIRPDHSLQKLKSQGTRNDLVGVIRQEVLNIRGSTVTTATPSIGPSVAAIVPYAVHAQDLVSGVYMSLWEEVAAVTVIKGSKLAALKEYVHHLAQLLPVTAHVRTWLERVDQWLAQQNAPIPSAVWRGKLTELQDSSGHISKRVSWVGCRASQENKRGYPCSLWTIFHTLTVAAYENPSKGITTKDVVLGMKGYIGSYFRCLECRGHFLKMSANVADEVKVEPTYSGLLWLWRAHNKVNRRLHGDPTEDIRHPKVQFPTYKACPACHTDKPVDSFQKTNTWKKAIVMDYLIEFYGAAKLEGLNDEQIGDSATSFFPSISYGLSLLVLVLCFIQTFL